MTKRRIGNHGDTVLLAPWYHRMLDRALLQMIEHLIAGDPALARYSEHLVEIIDIEIADAPCADLAGVREFLERRNGFRERVRSAPMQQIAIEPVGLQSFQRALASCNGATPRGVARQHLGNQKQIVALARDRLRNDELGIAIHLGGVDVGHAEIDAAAQRRDRALAIAAIDIPGALPDHGDFWAVTAEWLNSHVYLNTLRSATSTPPVADSVM